MATLREAAQMALETLDNMVKVDWHEWDEFASVEDFVRWAKSRASFTAEALRAALAQPEQELRAFYVYKPTLPRGNLGNVADGDLPWIYDQDPSSGYSARMLVYTTTPQREVYCGCGDEIVAGDGARCGTCVAVKYKEKEWQGLTDEEYEAMAEKHVTNCYFDTLKYAKAIEAKLKGKNSTSVMNQQTSDKND